MSNIKLIVAYNKDRAIGSNNKLPWYYPEDLKYFKRLTEGGVVVMGSNTYKSIGRMLPRRTNIVLTSQDLTIPGCIVCNSIEHVLRDLTDFWVIGGASLYEQLLPFCTELYVTEVPGTHPDCDTFFPELPVDLVEDESYRHGSVEGSGLVYKKYVRRLGVG